MKTFLKHFFLMFFCPKLKKFVLIFYRLDKIMLCDILSNISKHFLDIYKNVLCLLRVVGFFILNLDFGPRFKNYVQKQEKRQIY